MTDTQKPINLGKAWCSVHQMHPNECFEQHRPDVKEVRGALSAEDNAELIKAVHIKMQQANLEKQAEIPVEDENAQ